MKIKTAAEITTVEDSTIYAVTGFATFIPAGSILTVSDAVYQRKETILHLTFKGEKFVCYVVNGEGPNERDNASSTDFNLRTMKGAKWRARVRKNG